MYFTYLGPQEEVSLSEDFFNMHQTGYSLPLENTYLRQTLNHVQHEYDLGLVRPELTDEDENDIQNLFHLAEADFPLNYNWKIFLSTKKT